MNFCARLMAFVALLGTTLIGLGQYRPAWAAQFDLDWWSLPELCEELHRGEQDLAAQDEQRLAAVARLYGRSEVVEELRAGRLTLAQAAARFRRLNATFSEAPVDLRHYLGGATEEERLCRQVIYWAESAECSVPPTSGAQTRRRLEAELTRLLAENHGVIPLPE